MKNNEDNTGQQDTEKGHDTQKVCPYGIGEIKKILSKVWSAGLYYLHLNLFRQNMVQRINDGIGKALTYRQTLRVKCFNQGMWHKRLK